MDEIKEIVQKNKEYLENLEKRIARIERKFTWNTIFGFVKVIMIVAPLVFGIIYLSPIVKDYLKTITPVLSALNINLDKDNVNAPADSMIILPEESRELLCDPEIREALIEENCN